jgi:misacylated tRNA(Ala) deacylase
LVHGKDFVTISDYETELLYLEDSYLTEFEGRVAATSDTAVVLDRTLFYPRGGGQMADTGSLRSVDLTSRVVATERREGTVWHVLEKQKFSVGDKVHGLIDWPHRYQQMRTHTALHILCGVIYRTFGATVTGCQMYEDRARMDFALPDLTPERLKTIELLSNEAVKQGHAVRINWLPRTEANRTPDLIRTKVNLLPPDMDPVRTIEIVELDLQADGGTHVRNTFEVGGINILKTTNKGAENKRIEIAIPELPD